MIYQSRKLFGPSWVLHTMQKETYHGRKGCTHVKCDLLCRTAIQFVSYENFLTFLSPGMHGSSPNVNWAMWIMCPPSLFLVHSPILSENIYCREKSLVHRLWWKEHAQRTHLDVIERDVWFTNLEMLDKWYIQIHEISFFTFKSLVQQITPFITCSFIFVWKSLPICKVVKIVLHKLVDGIQLELTTNL